MEIKNIITQKELELVLRVANYFHKQFEWRFGQAIFNTIEIMFPDLSKEIRYPSPLDPFYKDTVKADFYAAICPDPVSVIPSTFCPMCRLEFEPEKEEIETEELSDQYISLSGTTDFNGTKQFIHVSLTSDQFNILRGISSWSDDNIVKYLNQQYPSMSRIEIDKTITLYRLLIKW